MKCEEYFVLLCGHLDGMNDTDEEERLQAHLTSCEECRTVLAQMRENDAALRETCEVPADLAEKIMHKVRKEPKKQKKRYWNVLASGLAAAAVLAVVILGGNGLRMPEEQFKSEAAPAYEIECLSEAPAEASTEKDQIVLRSAPMETEAQYNYAPEPAFGTKGVTDQFIVSEDKAFYGGATSAFAAENPTVLFVFASEVEELGECKQLDPAKISLPRKAKERYEALSNEDTGVYSVSYQLLHRLKEAYPCEYFEGSTERCYVYVIPTP